MSYKVFDLSQDVAALQSSINEVVNVSGSTFVTDANVKFYTNIASASTDGQLGGYFETLFDASPTSSLSTALMDVTFGYATGSSYRTAAASSTSSVNQKTKIYRQMANLLLGHPDNVFSVGGADKREAVFVLLKRNIQKDEIKKGTVGIVLNGASPAQYSASDQGASSGFKNAVGGDYAALKYNGTGSEVGLVYYQAGIVVLPPDAWGVSTVWSGSVTLNNMLYSGNINGIVDGFRKKTERIDFHNQTNLYSSIYFCRLTNSEFNYSSNPTFVDSNKRIRVTSGSNVVLTRTYPTTVGLYDSNDGLLAVGKLNKPVTKSPENEVVLRVRLDF